MISNEEQLIKYLERLENVELPKTKMLISEMDRYNFQDQANYFKGRKETLEWVIECTYAIIRDK